MIIRRTQDDVLLVVARDLAPVAPGIENEL
jgi:hypothetical protein